MLTSSAVFTTPFADLAHAQALRNGGLTVNLEESQPTSGFAYSPYPQAQVIVEAADFSPEIIDEYIDEHFHLLALPGHHLGLWEENGKFYLDVSVVGPASDETIQAAEAANQLAVFDLENFETIYTALGALQLASA